MRIITTGIFLIALLSLLPGNLPAANDVAITMEMHLNRDVIGLDEYALLSIVVTADKQIEMPTPKLPPLTKFKVSQAGNSTSLQFENGNVTYSVTFNYFLFPQQEGTFPIHKAWIVYGNNRFESNEASLQVAKSSQQVAGPAADAGKSNDGKTRDFFLVAEVDKKRAYVDEQITLTIKFYRGRDIVGNPGFGPPHAPDFWQQELPPQRQYTQIINGREYFVYELSYAYFPTKPGKLEISSAQMQVSVPLRDSRRGMSLFDMFNPPTQAVNSRSEKITIDVSPLPTDNKPASFSGAVGKYQISAGISKADPTVNEAITLRVKISGKGHVQSLPDPVLPDLKDFRVEKSNSEIKASTLNEEVGGTKVIEYLLIPRIPGRQTIDPIEFTYFDPDAKKYRSDKTPPITVDVAKGDYVESADIPYSSISGQKISLEETDIRYIKTSTEGASKTGRHLLNSPGFVVALALPLLILAGGMYDSSRRRHLRSNVAFVRNRKAKAEANRRLKKAARHLNDSEDGAFHAELSGAIFQLIADKMNLSAHGLTSEQVDAILQEKAVGDDLRKNTQEVLHLADFGRFAGGAANGTAKSDQFEKTREVIMSLGEKL